MKALTVVLLVALFAVSTVSSAHSHAEAMKLWEDFKKNFNRNYTAEEEPNRIICFIENLGKIEELNALNQDASFGITKFADLCLSEFRKSRGGFKPLTFNSTRGMKVFTPDNYPPQRFKHGVAEPPPPSGPSGPANFVDWRLQGVVRDVKDQGNYCAGSWAFSAIATVESAFAIYNHINVTLSEQELIDCSDYYGNDGCNGGDMGASFDYIENEGGIASAAQYGYIGTDGPCQTISNKMVQVDFWGTFPNTEAGIRFGCYAGGPVSVAVATMDDSAWQLYEDGVLQSCASTDVDSGVNVVGYNMNANPPYWIIRNSWGEDWGMDGYIYLEYGINQCGITNYAATQAVVADYP